MGKQQILLTHLFNTSVEEVFTHLTDHESFGRVINTPITRVVDSQEPNKNGTGSVRRINAFPFPRQIRSGIQAKEDLGGPILVRTITDPLSTANIQRHIKAFDTPIKLGYRNRVPSESFLNR